LLHKTDTDLYQVSIGCGGAILGLSDPVDEWKEMLTKSRPNLKIFGEFLNVKGINLEFNGYGAPPLFVHSSGSARLSPSRSLVESMRYEEGRGVWLFGRHVDRVFESLRWMKFEVERDQVEEKMRTAIMATTPTERGESHFLGDVEGFLEKSICGNSDWTMIAGPTGSWKIRVQVNMAGEWVSEWSSVNPNNPQNLVICPIARVDSTQELIRHKICDWVDVVGVGEKNFPRENLLLVNELGKVTETGIANIAIRKGGEWVTPPKTCGLLPGTLRAVAIERGMLKVGKILKEDLGEEILCFNSVRGFWLANVE